MQVIGESGCGVMHEDIGEAVRQALLIPRDTCRVFASGFGIKESARCFFDHVMATSVERA
jgi:hypothetical protein